MKKSLLISCILLFTVINQLAAQNKEIEKNLTEHLNFLASDEMRGRKTGSPEAKKAAEYVFEQFEKMGLEPEMELFSSGKKRNVIAKIPSKNEKYILIGSHYDGAGTSFGQILNAADDNASGTSVLIELAKILKDENLDYGVIFVAYDGEEAGLLGSRYNAKHINAEEIVLMISVDMVGHLEHEGRLVYEGAETLKDGKAFIEKSRIPNLTTRIYPVAQNSGMLTDTFYYDKLKIPSLNVLTGIETSNLHTTEDDVSSLDIPGMALITEHLVLLVKNVQNKVEPTGNHLYGESKTKFGISGTRSFGNFYNDTSINLSCMVPMGSVIGFGDIYLNPGIGFVTANILTEKLENKNLLGLNTPLMFISSIKADKVEIFQGLGPYYSIFFDENKIINQELGISFNLGIKPCNNCVDFLNKIGIAIETQVSFPNIFKNNMYSDIKSSSFGIKMIYNF